MSTASDTTAGGGGQLRALLSLRWHMLRSARQRKAAFLAFLLLPLLAMVAIVVGQLAPDDPDIRFNFALLAPTTFAAFFALAVISPASSAGGSELFPSDQLVAFPVRDRTVFGSTLLLAPANLAWMTNFLLLLGVTSYVAAPGPLVALALMTTIVYAAAMTVVGQAVAWWLEGARQSRDGRWSLRIIAASLALSLAIVQVTGNLTVLLNDLPTQRIAFSAVQGSEAASLPWQEGLRPWLAVVLLLVIAGVAAFPAGVRGCRFALGRVSDGGLHPESRSVRRRTTANSDLRALMQVDRASVWRSAPLRRGAIVMAVLPGTIAAITEPRWDSLVLLTGLVSAGSGLLFGVNAFGVDGAGALTLEGLPVSPELRFWAKALVIVEFAALTEAGALLVGALRADGSPTAPQLTALFAALVVTALAVASFCMRVSVRAPHRSDLRGRRDTPAPPGAMVAYSARLAWRTTWIAMVLSIVALAPWAWLPLAVATPMACLAGLSLTKSARQWQDETVRSRVVATVASG
jgi:hypothetical protein